MPVLMDSAKQTNKQRLIVDLRVTTTTDVDGFFGAWEALAPRLAESGCRQASTLLGVQRLAFPELLVEIEATAVV